MADENSPLVKHKQDFSSLEQKSGSVVLDWSKEKWDECSELAPGVWSISTRHRPGESKNAPEINNRCFIFLVTEKNGDKVLLCIGLGKPDLMCHHIDKLVQETGAPLKYMLSQGGIHTLFIIKWIERYPEAVAYVEPDRIPEFTQIGRRAFEEYGSSGRVVALPREGDCLPQFKGQVEFVLLRGYGTHSDVPSASEGASDSCCAFVMKMRSIMETNAVAHSEVYCFHPASGLLLVGDNMAFYFPEGATIPTMIKMNGGKNDDVAVNVFAFGVRNAPLLKASWEKILALPFTQHTGYHELPGVYCPNSHDRVRDAVEVCGNLSGVAPKKKGCCSGCTLS